MVHIKKRESLIRLVQCSAVQCSAALARVIMWKFPSDCYSRDSQSEQSKRLFFLSFFFLILGQRNNKPWAFSNLSQHTLLILFSFFFLGYYCAQITTQVAQFPVTLNNTEIGCIQSSTASRISSSFSSSHFLLVMVLQYISLISPLGSFVLSFFPQLSSFSCVG